MIDTLAMHGIQAKDLVPSLMTTHTVANPEYDPAEARRQAEIHEREAAEQADKNSEDLAEPSRSPTPTTPIAPSRATAPEPAPKPVQTTARVLENSSASVPGVSTHLSAADKNVTLDIRWTVLCDLFLILVADSVYDARSRVLLENVALKLGLGWLDVVRFESRVTETLDIQEEVESLEAKEKVAQVKQNTKKRRYMMMGLATLGEHYPEHVCRQCTNIICRWWTRHRSLRWPPSARHRCRFGRSFRYCWYYRHNRFLSRSWRRRCNHNWRRLNRLWHCCERYGSANAVC
jgi:hypothetical protein